MKDLINLKQRLFCCTRRNREIFWNQSKKKISNEDNHRLTITEEHSGSVDVDVRSVESEASEIESVCSVDQGNMDLRRNSAESRGGKRQIEEDLSSGESHGSDSSGESLENYDERILSME